MSSLLEGEDYHLKEAAIQGDVEFLQRCRREGKPIQYYMASFPQTNNSDRYNGNLFHIAVVAKKEEFIREAIGMLPPETTQQLLLQQRPLLLGNPLHIAVDMGNVDIVKMIVDVFFSGCVLRPSQQRPWLLKDSREDTPCHIALRLHHDECALEMFKADTEFLAKIFIPTWGNIFHFAAHQNREDFIREAIKLLPNEVVKQLLVETPINGNPLHEAAFTGNVEIVNMFLDVFSSPLPSDHSKRPWLLPNSLGNNPCFVALFSHYEDCALQILKMDTQILCNCLDDRGSMLLSEAVVQKCSRLALEILRYDHQIGFTGFKGYTPFHFLSYLQCSDDAKEIVRLLLRREPEIIKKINEKGYSAFHVWAQGGKMWPFKTLLESIDIIPDVKKHFVDLISHTNTKGCNPFHNLAQLAPNEEVAIEISKLLVFHKQEASSSISEVDLPWSVQDNDGDTPLSLAIDRKFQKLALYFISVDENTIAKCQKNALILAIEKGCHEVAQTIMDIVDNKQWTQLLTNQQQFNVLHLAPLCTKEFCERLMERHPDLLKGVAKEGATVLHSWVKNCEIWLLELILNSNWRDSFTDLIEAMDYKDRNNPFHTAAATTTTTTTTNDTTTHEAKIQVLTLLVEAYKLKKPNWTVTPFSFLPWFKKNKKSQGPLHLAINNNSEALAIYILSLYRPRLINKLLDYYNPECSTLFLAIKNNCTKVAKEILARLDNKTWTTYLQSSSTGLTILHLAPNLKDEEFGTWLVGEASEFIGKEDNEKQTPLDKASNVGAAWFIEAVLEKDPRALESAPLAWVKACENGHIAATRAFIVHNPGKFRDVCIKLKDSPLHHVHLPSLTEYEELIKIPRMKDLINLQNSKGQTPLHIAISKRDISLTEILLGIDNVTYYIKDKENNKTAIDMLEEVCKEKEEWEEMCYRNGLNPYVKTSYFQRQTNLLEVRNSLFVVAALLATITFTAGFTLPGGLSEENGEALLTKKTAFLAFLMFDTLGMCSSMLVLICLVWSMINDSKKALVLIDRSMMILMVAFYSTLLAFMTGVYTVTSPKVLWAAIIVIFMCSLIGISAYKSLLYKILFISSTKKKKSQIHGVPQV